MQTHSKQLKLPTSEAIEKVLGLLNVKQSASEVHGNICGFLCVGDLDKAQAYIQSLLTSVDVEKFEKEIKSLVSLFKTSFEQMGTMSFDFHLLIPDDDAPLKTRSQSLGLWCYGFSEGILQAGVEVEQLHSEEARDALFHITEIANLDYDEVSVTEEDEKAYMEVYEYVRMSVLMIHTELTKKPVSIEVEENRTIH